MKCCPTNSPFSNPKVTHTHGLVHNIDPFEESIIRILSIISQNNESNLLLASIGVLSILLHFFLLFTDGDSDAFSTFVCRMSHFGKSLDTCYKFPEQLILMLDSLKGTIILTASLARFNRIEISLIGNCKS